MRLIITRPARADLEEIRIYLEANYPRVSRTVTMRLRETLVRIEKWPHIGKEVRERPGVHIVPIVRYPYKIFYRVKSNTVEILHIHHSSRK